MTETITILRARGLTLAVAESDTGGLVLERLTSVPGSSVVIIGGVVAYADSFKTSVLGVPQEMLRQHGAVSAQVALAMAAGMRRLAATDVALATTGIAGPGGATETKPVGLAFVAAVSAEKSLVREHRWQGDRAQNRAASADAVLDLLIELL